MPKPVDFQLTAISMLARNPRGFVTVFVLFIHVPLVFLQFCPYHWLLVGVRFVGMLDMFSKLIMFS